MLSQVCRALKLTEVDASKESIDPKNSEDQRSSNAMQTIRLRLVLDRETMVPQSAWRESET